MPIPKDFDCPEGFSWVIIAFAWFCGFTAGGIYYLAVSNTHDGEYWGTLISVSGSDVSDSDSEGGRNLYLVEKFRKDNTSNTCGVTRLQAYYTIRELNKAKDRVILGTGRQIWARMNDARSCYDTSIRNYETTLGISLLVIAVGFPLLLYLVCLIKKDRCRPSFPIFHQRYTSPRSLNLEREASSHSSSSHSALYRNVENHHPFESREPELVDLQETSISSRSV
jgi:hypothetical protein